MHHSSTGSGRRRAAHKVELMVDLGRQALVAIQVCGADRGDTTSLPRSLLQAFDNQQTTKDLQLYLFIITWGNAGKSAYLFNWPKAWLHSCSKPENQVLLLS